MKTPAGTLRTTAYLLLVPLISVGLAACGGGGGSSTSPGTSGPAKVSVSIASAPSFPAGTALAPSTAISSPSTAAPPANSPTFDNIFVTVTKLALIPSTGEDKSVTDPLAPPIQIDLLNLPGDDVATLLNQFSGVPAGEYSKIRVYYDDVVGRSGNDNTVFHPTANSHFDVHFVGGNLVIPVTTDPEGGIRFFSVVINVVGLKHHEAGQSGNVLLRPQVFAEVVGDPKFIVTGVADQVSHADGTFVVKAVNDNISAAYGSDTSWFYVDGRFVGPFTSLEISGNNVLRDTALVDVIGIFQSGVLVAERVDITFPGEKSGAVDNGWRADNTFILRLAVDNVVFPMPDRFLAFYDNAVAPHGLLTDAAIDNNVQVEARGYNVAAGIEAYWITIGP